MIIQNKKPAATSSIAEAQRPKTIQKTLVKPCIFDQDDDDEDEPVESQKNSKNMKPTSLVNINTTENRIRKQTQIQIENALKQDAEIFEYDSIYDKLEEEKNKLDPKLKNKNESKEVGPCLGFIFSLFRELYFQIWNSFFRSDDVKRD